MILKVVERGKDFVEWTIRSGNESEKAQELYSRVRNSLGFEIV